MNQPVIGPDGTAAMFLGEDGEYNLVLEQGTIHLFKDGESTALPLTATSESCAILDWNSESQEFLYVEYEVGEWLESGPSTLYRVAADPASGPVVVHTSELTIRDAEFRADGRIVLLEQGDEITGTLSLLDPATGEMDEVSDAIFGFRQDANRETLYLFAIDEQSLTSIGVIGPWEPDSDGSEPLAVFLLSAGMLESFLLVDDEFFWDIDPSGSYVALALYDNVMVAPKVDEEVPTLLLIKDGERLTQIAEIGYMPVFSPDGRYLAYMGSEDGQTGQALLYELRTFEKYPVPGTQGATTCFWMANDQLGVAFESDDDDYRVMVYNFNTGELIRLIE